MPGFLLHDHSLDLAVLDHFLHLLPSSVWQKFFHLSFLSRIILYCQVLKQHACLFAFFNEPFSWCHIFRGYHTHFFQQCLSCVPLTAPSPLPFQHFLGVMSSQNQDFEFERANMPLIYNSNVSTKKLESKEIVSLGFSS